MRRLFGSDIIILAGHAAVLAAAKFPARVRKDSMVTVPGPGRPRCAAPGPEPRTDQDLNTPQTSASMIPHSMGIMPNWQLPIRPMSATHPPFMSPFCRIALRPATHRHFPASHARLEGYRPLQGATTNWQLPIVLGAPIITHESPRWRRNALHHLTPGPPLTLMRPIRVKQHAIGRPNPRVKANEISSRLSNSSCLSSLQDVFVSI